MPTKTLLKKTKVADPVNAKVCAPVTPTSTKGGKSRKDDSDNSINDFVVEEFRVHREAALRRHERERLTYTVDTKHFSYRKNVNSMRSQSTNR